MEHLNRFGKLRLDYLQTRKPQMLRSMEKGGLLVRHLLTSQKNAHWEWEQLVFAGMDEAAAEALVLQEYILA